MPEATPTEENNDKLTEKAKERAQDTRESGGETAGTEGQERTNGSAIHKDGDHERTNGSAIHKDGERTNDGA